MFWKRVRGLVSDNQCQALYDLCRAPEVCRVIETGSFCGKSTMALAAALSGKPDALLITVDPFVDYDIGDGRMFRGTYGDVKAQFFKNVEASGYSPIIDHCDEIPEPEKLRELDGVFIDGDHRYEAVKADVEKIYPHLKPGGWLILHDYGSHEGPTRLGKEMCWQLRDVKLIENMALGYKP